MIINGTHYTSDRATIETLAELEKRLHRSYTNDTYLSWHGSSCEDHVDPYPCVDIVTPAFSSIPIALLLTFAPRLFSLHLGLDIFIVFYVSSALTLIIYSSIKTSRTICCERHYMARRQQLICEGIARGDIIPISLLNR